MATSLIGIPSQNNIIELYPLFKFLGIRPYHELEAFKRTFAQPIQSGKGAGRAMGKLQVRRVIVGLNEHDSE
jgi:SNF2 family DNA or RNA helicase